MTKRIAMVAALALVGAGSSLHAQQADLRILTATLGYGQASVTDLGTVPDRTMRGFNVGADLHILSLVLRGLPVRIYDAVHFDLTYGKMTSDTLSYLNLGEDNSTLVYTAGYQLLAGGQLGGVALLGGLGYMQYNQDIGSSTMSGNVTPIIARAEFGGRRRIVVTGMAGGDGFLGGRVDVPLFRRLNLTASYWQVDGTTQLWSSPAGTLTPATAKMLLVGVRTAELR